MPKKENEIKIQDLGDGFLWQNYTNPSVDLSMLESSHVPDIDKLRLVNKLLRGGYFNREKAQAKAMEIKNDNHQ